MLLTSVDTNSNFYQEHPKVLEGRGVVLYCQTEINHVSFFIYIIYTKFKTNIKTKFQYISYWLKRGQSGRFIGSAKCLLYFCGKFLPRVSKKLPRVSKRKEKKRTIASISEIQGRKHNFLFGLRYAFSYFYVDGFT